MTDMQMLFRTVDALSPEDGSSLMNALKNGIAQRGRLSPQKTLLKFVRLCGLSTKCGQNDRR